MAFISTQNEIIKTNFELVKNKQIKKVIHYCNYDNTYTNLFFYKLKCKTFVVSRINEQEFINKHSYGDGRPDLIAPIGFMVPFKRKKALKGADFVMISDFLDKEVLLDLVLYYLGFLRYGGIMHVARLRSYDYSYVINKLDELFHDSLDIKIYKYGFYFEYRSTHG